MKRYTAEELKEILKLHVKWLNGKDGSRANLSDADLSGADLSGADLSDANLRNANLSDANLSDANLSDTDLNGADLYSADLSGADLRSADLRWVDLRGADLSGADLSGADLYSADLSGADLSGANLYGLNGNLKHIKSLQIETYYITYTSKVIQIGCQRHGIEEWKNFNDDEILKMDGREALEWWNKWKPVLMQIIEMSPCKETR